MAAKNHPLIFVINFEIIIIVYLSLINCYVLGGRILVESDHFITFDATSLFSTSTCKPSLQGPSSPASLKVTHIHGPCSKLGKGDKNVQTLAEVLARDQIHVASIQKRHASNAKFDKPSISSKSTVSVPAKSGRNTLGTGNYVVSVGLGTPAKYLNLEFDTGSSLIWTQCEPCQVSCYNQNDPIFDPSASSSYKNVSCNSTECSQLLSNTGSEGECSQSSCIYGTAYEDQSFSAGFLGKEKFTLTPNDVFDEISFGCGGYNSLIGKTAGMLGLGRDSLSLVSQTADKYEKCFSYCLPTKSGSNGHLSFGKNEETTNFVFTPFASSPRSTFYAVIIEGISVKGRQLAIDPSVFQSGGSVIDSGTVITRLAPTSYMALRDAFRQEMSNYPSAPATSLLDTCYDFTNYTTVAIPVISFSFAGNVKVDLDFTGTFFMDSQSQVCLAFAANKADTDLGIYGNVQQQTFEIVYDVAGGRLGFGPGGCS